MCLTGGTLGPPLGDLTAPCWCLTGGCGEAGPLWVLRPQGRPPWWGESCGKDGRTRASPGHKDMETEASVAPLQEPALLAPNLQPPASRTSRNSVLRKGQRKPPAPVFCYGGPVQGCDQEGSDNQQPYAEKA